MAGEDVTLRLGGDAEALVAAVKQGGDAFAAFVQKTVGHADQLGKKLREVSGADVIADAGHYAKAVELIGGATKLTAAEKAKLNATLSTAIEKYQALGIEAPAALRKLAKETDQLPPKYSLINDLVGRLGPALVTAFTVGAVAKLAGDFIGLTSSLVDLEGKTQINVVGLHKMKLALQDSGVQLETAANASNVFQQRLAEGDTSVLSAMQRLGVNIAEIRALKPEDQFFIMADAVGKVGDQGQRISLVNDLFGRQGKELLPALNGRLKETADAYERMGLVLDEDVIRAGDQLGDQWAVLKSAGGALLASVLSPIVPTLSLVATGVTKVALAGAPLVKWLIEVTTPMKRFTESLDLAGDALEEMGLKATTLPQVHGDAAKALDASRKAAQARIAVPITLSLAEEERVTKQLTEAIEQSIEEKKKAAAAAEAYRQKIDALADRLSGRGIQREIADLRVAWSHLSAEERAQPENVRAIVAMYDTLRARLAPGALPRDLENLWLKAHEGFEKLQTISLTDMFKFDTTTPTFNPLVQFGFEQDKKYALKFEDIFTFDKTAPIAPIKGWAVTIEGWASQLPQQIARSFEGGGGWKGALLASASTGGTAALSQIFGKPGESGLLKNMNGILGQVLSSAVPVIGALIGPALSKLGKLFGIGINDEVKKANSEIEKVRQQLLATHGPMDQLEAKARAVGLSFEANWGHQGQAGLAAFNTLVDEFTTRWEALNQELADTRSELQGALGDARDLGFEFNDSGELTRVHVDKMREAAKAYGVDLAALGPAFQSARIQEQATGIINTFTLLDKGGTDTGTILVGMKDEIGRVVGESLRFGTEIPANMKPWIQNLIETNQLTDENGVAITDLSKIKFGEPVATEFEKISEKIRTLVDAIALLVDRLTTTITPAIANATRDRTVRIGFDVDDLPEIDLEDRRGDGASRGFARGGLVRSATRAVICEGGEPELVGPVSFMTDALAGALRQVAVMERAVGSGPTLFPAPAPDLATAILGGLSSALRSDTAQAPANRTEAPETVHLSFQIDTLDITGVELFLERKFLPALTRTLERGRGLRDLQSALELR